jgi:hypothetical protein
VYRCAICAHTKKGSPPMEKEKDEALAKIILPTEEIYYNFIKSLGNDDFSFSS